MSVHFYPLFLTPADSTMQYSVRIQHRQQHVSRGRLTVVSCLFAVSCSMIAAAVTEVLGRGDFAGGGETCSVWTETSCPSTASRCS